MWRLSFMNNWRGHKSNFKNPDLLTISRLQQKFLSILDSAVWMLQTNNGSAPITYICCLHRSVPHFSRTANNLKLNIHCWIASCSSFFLPSEIVTTSSGADSDPYHQEQNFCRKWELTNIEDLKSHITIVPNYCFDD